MASLCWKSNSLLLGKKKQTECYLTFAKHHPEKTTISKKLRKIRTWLHANQTRTNGTTSTISRRIFAFRPAESFLSLKTPTVIDLRKARIGRKGFIPYLNSHSVRYQMPSLRRS